MTTIAALPTLPVVVCDCGHPSTPSKFTSGYAVRESDGKTLCYQCAADVNREEIKAMKHGDPPVFCYVSGPQPEPNSCAPVQIITWGGVVLGRGTVYRGGKYDNQMHVVATVEGRRLWGKTPTHNGNYTRLHLYRDQK